MLGSNSLSSFLSVLSLRITGVHNQACHPVWDLQKTPRAEISFVCVFLLWCSCLSFWFLWLISLPSSPRGPLFSSWKLHALWLRGYCCWCAPKLMSEFSLHCEALKQETVCPVPFLFHWPEWLRTSPCSRGSLASYRLQAHLINLVSTATSTHSGTWSLC